MKKRNKSKLSGIPRGYRSPKGATSLKQTSPSSGLWHEDVYIWWIALAGLLALTYFAYHYGLTSKWFLDDYGNIVNNQALKLSSLSLPTLWHAVWSFSAGPLGRPISLASFAIERYFFGLNPYVFKVTNLCLHLVTTVLVAGFTRSLLAAWRSRFQPDTSAWRLDWIAFAIAAFWALHPMNLTPILYAVQRETILANMFMVAGLWAYVAIRRHLSTSWPTVFLLIVTTATFTGLSAFSKSIGALLPLLIFLVEFFVLRFREHNDQRPNNQWLYYLLRIGIISLLGLAWVVPYFYSHGLTERLTSLAELVLLVALLASALVFSRQRTFFQGERNKRFYLLLAAGPIILVALWLLNFFKVPGFKMIFAEVTLISLLLGLDSFFLRIRNHDDKQTNRLWVFFWILLVSTGIFGLLWMIPSTFPAGYVGRSFDLGERVLTEGRVVVFYLGLVVAPRLSAMGLYHDDIAISTGLLSPPTTILSFLLIAALLVAAWWLRKRKPLVALGIVWFFAAQLLESTIWPLEIAFEHRIYLADWGIILAVFALVILPLRRLHWRRLGIAACVLVFAGLATMTTIRSWHWRSNLALAKVLAHNHPNSPRSTYLLARIYTNKALSGHERYAQLAFQKAHTAALVPHAGLDPWVAMVLLAAQTGRKVQPSWFDGMVKAVKDGPLTVSDVNALEALVGCYSKHQCKIQRSSLNRLFKAIYHSPRITELGMNYANVLVTQANLIGYDTPAQRARSGPLLIKAAKAMPDVAQFQVNVFNVELEDGHIEAARKALEDIRKINHLGKLDYLIDRLEPQLEEAERRASATSAATSQ